MEKAELETQLDHLSGVAMQHARDIQNVTIRAVDAVQDIRSKTTSSSSSGPYVSSAYPKGTASFVALPSTASSSALPQDKQRKKFRMRIK